MKKSNTIETQTESESPRQPRLSPYGANMSYGPDQSSPLRGIQEWDEFGERFQKISNVPLVFECVSVYDLKWPEIKRGKDAAHVLFQHKVGPAVLVLQNKHQTGEGDETRAYVWIVMAHSGLKKAKAAKLISDHLQVLQPLF